MNASSSDAFYRGLREAGIKTRCYHWTLENHLERVPGRRAPPSGWSHAADGRAAGLADMAGWADLGYEASAYIEGHFFHFG
jgi:hypothetical protein